MTRDIAIVAIDLPLPKNDNASTSEFENYNKLSAKQKIDKLVNDIDRIAAQLKEKQPKREWMIVWREYGITGSDNRFISAEEKKYLKEKMTQLTDKYQQNNLTIISGSVSTIKTITGTDEALRERLTKTQNYYETNAFSIEEDDDNIKEHANDIKNILRRKKIGSYTELRNTTYIFNQGKCIGRHDKMLPFEENLQKAATANWWTKTNTDARIPNLVYRPGNQKNPFGIFDIPAKNKKPLKIAVETCREHLSKTLKYFALKNKLPKEMIDIHFLLSLGMNVYLDSIHGKNFIHADSTTPPSHITTKVDKEPGDHDILLYEYNALSPHPEIYQPIERLHPNEFIVVQQFYKIADYLDENSNMKYEGIDVYKSILNSYLARYLTSVATGIPITEDCHLEYMELFEQISDLPSSQHDSLLGQIHDLSKLIRIIPLETKATINRERLVKLDDIDVDTQGTTQENSQQSVKLFSRAIKPPLDFNQTAVGMRFAKLKLELRHSQQPWLDLLLTIARDDYVRLIEKKDWQLEINAYTKHWYRELRDEFSQPMTSRKMTGKKKTKDLKS